MRVFTHYSVATGLFFRIILCAVVKVQAASLRFVLISTFRFISTVRFETVQFSLSRTLKTIQNLIFANATDFLFDAVRPLLILRFLLQLLTFVSLAVL